MILSYIVSNISHKHWSKIAKLIYPACIQRPGITFKCKKYNKINYSCNNKLIRICVITNK